MTLAELSIKRPIFITCIVIVMLVIGFLALKRLPVDLFPDVNFPIVSVRVSYPGAGPEEIETLISRPLEEEFGSISGMKTLRSINKEGMSLVLAEFNLDVDIKNAEQQVRDRLASARRKLPEDIEEPVVRRMDPADQPILILSVAADLGPAELYDLVYDNIKPKIEQVNQVGFVEILGGRKREIRVELNREKLKFHELSATQVATRIGAAGQNIPAGKVSNPTNETVIRTLGQFKSLEDIRNLPVNFVGNDVPITVRQLGEVVDDLEEKRSASSVNGKPALLLYVFRQSGSNTIAVAKGVHKRVAALNTEFGKTKGAPKIEVVRDSSLRIAANVADVQESILIGIVLTVLVVFLFLGSFRSTIITGLALPNSLLGSFILMAAAGFTVNIMSLLALSLAVGLLVDDAIVVRENIFRHLEMGKTPRKAALEGTLEVTLAVIATSLTVIAVFGPIGFLDGVVGQFFKEFGLTVCFAMMISLFDALTIAPMMSAYFAGKAHDQQKGTGVIARLLGRFNKFQDGLENKYESILHFVLAKPKTVLLGSLGVFVLSIFALKFVPKTFLPPQDNGEFQVSLEMLPGTSLDAMTREANQVEEVVRKLKEVNTTVLTVGNQDGESNVATIFVNLVKSKDRDFTTSEMKDQVRVQLKPFAHTNPKVKDIDMSGGGQRAFNLNIAGGDLVELEKVATQVFDKLKVHPALLDAEISHKPGKPEFQAFVDNKRAQDLGVSSSSIGQELRTLVEGTVPAVFREQGREYDIRVRLREDQRDLQANYEDVLVPNINNRPIRLSAVSNPVKTAGPASINRQDRGRYIQIAADIAPKGPGMGGVITDVKQLLTKDMPLPEGMRFAFVGQAENFQELMVNMMIAAGLGILFIYLVLSSLYESFITPLTIMLVLPLAAVGAFFALLITQKTLDIFSMIGCIMLLGIATKNSILLVDATKHLLDQGMARKDAILKAGRIRLRPILMTSFALIAGMLPVAIGLNEASRQRTSMGMAIIGGLVSSTLLTLVVIPAAFSYIDDFKNWIAKKMQKVTGTHDETVSNGQNQSRKKMESAHV